MPINRDSIIIEAIKDLKQDILFFRNDAEEKIDHFRNEIKEELIFRFNHLNEKINNLEGRFEKLEEKNEILQNHQFQLDELGKDLRNLSLKLRNHIESHIKEAPRLAVSRFQIITIWSIFGIIFTGFFAKITGILDKIINFFK